jgi:hypothetical protein
MLGTITATALLNEPRDIAAYTDLFDCLEELAVCGDRARLILAAVADRYRQVAARRSAVQSGRPSRAVQSRHRHVKRYGRCR